jgi:4-hydroxy-3-polyprenylbenzoate decarboxylase
MRLVIGISGASGAIYGIRALQVLKKSNVETHLVLTDAARETIRLETDYRVTDVESLASYTHQVGDIASKLASGSFHTDGMVVIPCSMKTLGGIASGYSENLLLRAAEVTMKEKRPLILVVRETPMTLIQLENMVTAARAGAVILPAMPAFYHHPKSIDDLVNQVVGRVFDILGVRHELYPEYAKAEYTKKGAATTSSSRRKKAT